MIIIWLYIWLESSLLIMRQQTNLFGRVWSMRPEWAWANIGGQKGRQKWLYYWLIILLVIVRCFGWIMLYIFIFPFSFPCTDSWISWSVSYFFEWMCCTALPAFCHNKVPDFLFHLKKRQVIEYCKIKTLLLIQQSFEPNRKQEVPDY